MNTIRILKITGIVLGAGALVVGGILIYRKFFKKDEIDYSDPQSYAPPSSGSSGTGTSYSQSSSYTKSEVKAMQTWLIKTATFKRNDTILEAIRTTGGIDGIMGSGFQTALREAIAKGYVYSLDDLYYRSQNQ